MSSREPFWSAVSAFVAMPGVVAYLVPFLFRTGAPTPQTEGLIVLAIGTALLFWCVRDFYVAGLGTLAPWAPPKRLVIVGLYRFSRNPMYVSVLTIIIGWAITFSSRALWIYAAAVTTAFHLRVVFGEEPCLHALTVTRGRSMLNLCPDGLGFDRCAREPIISRPCNRNE